MKRILLSCLSLLIVTIAIAQEIKDVGKTYAPPLAPGKNYGEKAIGGVAFVWIPGGTFIMGSLTSNMSSPLRKITIDGFWMSKYEVTQKIWEVIMNENPSTHKAGPNYPVDSVTWVECDEFFKKFNAKYKITNARFPTEAEWEYAARGGVYDKYPWGSEPSFALKYFDTNAKNTYPVGQFLPNGYGLYDVVGNVQEWCLDWFESFYLVFIPDKNPVRATPSIGNYGKPARGGRFGSGIPEVTTRGGPQVYDDIRVVGMGLRMVLSDAVLQPAEKPKGMYQ